MNSWDEMIGALSLNLSDPNHCDIAPTGIPYGVGMEAVWEILFTLNIQFTHSTHPPTRQQCTTS